MTQKFCKNCTHFAIQHPALTTIKEESELIQAQFFEARMLSHGVCLNAPFTNLINGQTEYRMALYERMPSPKDSSIGACGEEGIYFSPSPGLIAETSETSETK